MSDSSGEANFPEYDTDSNQLPYACTLTISGIKGSSNVKRTVDPSEILQHALDKQPL